MAIYVIIITTGMLLVYHDYYYDILETKFTFYCVCTIAMFVLTGCYLFLTAHPWTAIKTWKGKKFFQIISPVLGADHYFINHFITCQKSSVYRQPGTFYRLFPASFVCSVLFLHYTVLPVERMAYGSVSDSGAVDVPFWDYRFF